jgi:hypothetical protein
MPLAEPTLDELLAAVACDLVVIQRFRGMGRDLWPTTMQPLLFRCAGLAAAAADKVAFKQNREALVALSTAIIGIMPPDDGGVLDESAWERLAIARAGAEQAFAVER